jgi:hypothetical protein
MGSTTVLLLLLGVALISAVIYIAVRQRPRLPISPSAAPAGRALTDQAEVVLPVDDADPDAPATQRIVAEAARRALDDHPEVTTVVVRSAGGRELGRVHRTETPPPKPFVDVPDALLEPHAHRHPGPGDPVEHKPGAAVSAHVRFSDEPPHRQMHKTLAEHFDLPDGVRQKIAHPDDAVDIVRAILSAAGVPFDVDDNVIVCGDRALVVIRTSLHGAVGSEHLDAAYLRFERSHVKRGVVVTPGTIYPHEISRRHALAPALLHAGPDGIQRMADAAAIGADPLDFVVGIH